MNRFILVVGVGLVVVALSWGLSIVGGPSQARAEKADAQRGRDLQRLRTYLECKRGDDVLPQSLAETDYCPGLRGGVAIDDPVTGEAYDYRRHSDDRFEVCAQFAVAQDTPRTEPRWRHIVFDGQTGCVAGQRGSR